MVFRKLSSAGSDFSFTTTTTTIHHPPPPRPRPISKILSLFLLFFFSFFFLPFFSATHLIQSDGHVPGRTASCPQRWSHSYRHGVPRWLPSSGFFFFFRDPSNPEQRTCARARSITLTRSKMGPQLPTRGSQVVPPTGVHAAWTRVQPGLHHSLTAQGNINKENMEQRK